MRANHGTSGRRSRCRQHLERRSTTHVRHPPARMPPTTARMTGQGNSSEAGLAKGPSTGVARMSPTDGGRPMSSASHVPIGQSPLGAHVSTTYAFPFARTHVSLASFVWNAGLLEARKRETATHTARAPATTRATRGVGRMMRIKVRMTVTPATATPTHPNEDRAKGVTEAANPAHVLSSSIAQTYLPVFVNRHVSWLFRTPPPTDAEHVIPAIVSSLFLIHV